MPDQAVRSVRSAWRVYNQTARTPQDLFCENKTKISSFFKDRWSVRLWVNRQVFLIAGRVVFTRIVECFDSLNPGHQEDNIVDHDAGLARI